MAKKRFVPYRNGKGFEPNCKQGGSNPVPYGNGTNGRKRNELEDFVCAEFIEHDIMFLSELLRNMSIDIECPFCTSLFERLMAIRGDLKKELAFFSEKSKCRGNS